MQCHSFGTYHERVLGRNSGCLRSRLKHLRQENIGVVELQCENQSKPIKTNFPPPPKKKRTKKNKRYNRIVAKQAKQLHTISQGHGEKICKANLALEKRPLQVFGIN